MIYFPQLQTGAAAQFPLEKAVAVRTIDCEFADGSMMRAADPGARAIHWKLTYKGLTDSEWEELESCFQTTRGRLKSFCLLDPFDNLLSWSADPTKPVWTVAPGIELTTGAEDIAGGTTGLVVTNRGATTQRISQGVDTPGYYQYCWSAYFRQAGNAQLKMLAETSDGGTWMDVPKSEKWQRFTMPSSIPGNAESIVFGVDLPGGATVDICGLQVDAQPNASRMRTTRARSGVYPHCRFDQDELTLHSAGPNDHATTITIISQLSL